MDTAMKHGALGSIVVLAIASFPARSEASNERHDRTPVLWRGPGACAQPDPEPACMTLHDRSRAITLHLPYEIPKEDVETAPDEVADSRTHQFLAFCRPHRAGEDLPTWISTADVATAAAIDLVDPTMVADDDVLETSTVWEDCWFRITADDDRRPIDCDSVSAGVDWDTSAVPAGVYTIDGFTNEPVANLWSLRPGVVKVHDGDPDAVGPAAAFTTGELVMYRDDVAVLDGCVDAIDGTTFTLEWGLESSDVEWNVYAADVPIAGPTFEIEFAPPAEIVGEMGLLRAVFTDPRGRSYTSYIAKGIVVYDLDNPMGCDDGGFIGGDQCNDTGTGDSTGMPASTSEGGGTDTGTSTTDAPAGTSEGAHEDPDEPPKEGCGCGVDPRGGFSWVALGLLVWRRRNRHRGVGPRAIG